VGVMVVMVVVMPGTIRCRRGLQATHDVNTVHGHPFIQPPVIPTIMHVIIKLRRPLLTLILSGCLCLCCCCCCLLLVPRPVLVLRLDFWDGFCLAGSPTFFASGFLGGVAVLEGDACRASFNDFS